MVISGLVFSIFGIIIGIVASIVDGISSNFFHSIEGCYNPNNQKFYGSSDAGVCSIFTYSSLFGYSCFCNSGGICYEYDLKSGNDCGLIMTTYADMLSASTAFCVMCTLTLFAYSILTCTSVCCKPKPATPPAVGEGTQYTDVHVAVAVKA